MDPTNSRMMHRFSRFVLVKRVFQASVMGKKRIGVWACGRIGMQPSLQSFLLVIKPSECDWEAPAQVGRS
jgi:hypothetical protein